MSVQVIFCNCGKTLNDKLDFGALEKFVKDIEGVYEVISTETACTSKGIRELSDAFIDQGDKVVALACSRSVCQYPLEEAMRKANLNPDRLVIVNAKEQLGWVHDDVDKATQKAKMLLKAAVVKVKSLEPFEMKRYDRYQKAIVVGGGIAGLTAASELVDHGFDVHVIERKPAIGGTMTLISKTYPEEDCSRCLRGPQMITLLNKPGIKYHVSTEVKEVEKCEKGFKVKIEKKPVNLDLAFKRGKGQPVEAVLEGNEYRYVYPEFEASKIDKALLKQVASSKCNDCTSLFPAGLLQLDNDELEETLEIGSVILATGFKDYDPSNITKYGYGLDNVITQFQVARFIDPFGPTGGMLLRPSDAKRPDSIIMIQCVGSRDKEYNSYCSKYCCMAAIKHATVIKKLKNPEADITILYRDIRASGYGFEALYNEAKDLGINFVHGDVLNVSSMGKGIKIEYTDGMGNDQTLNAELVALSTGMVPSDGAEEIAELFNVEVTESGFMKEIDEKVANITTRVPGIFIAGACASPKNIPDSIAQAGAAGFMSGAYMKSHVEKKVNHPTVNQENCGKCGICNSVCPYKAINIPENDYPQFNPELCQSCGLCVSSCPTHALETPNYGFDLIEAQVDAIVNERGNETLILSFACDDCGYNLLDTIGFEKVNYSESFVPIYVNCMSNLSLRHVLDAVNKGVDGIMLLGCVKDRCHFLKGTKRSKGQMHVIENFFMTMSIKTPIKILESSGSMVSQFTEALSELETRVMEEK